MAEDQNYFGSIEPIPEGDPILLTKNHLRIGRRNACDIVLNFSNVSGHHALLEIDQGYWFIKDLRSRNGVTVDGQRILQGLKKRLDPNVVFAIAKHGFIIRYEPGQPGDFDCPPPNEILDNHIGDSTEGTSGAIQGTRPWDAPRKPPPMGGAAKPADEDKS